jgi:hypothetical protein
MLPSPRSLFFSIERRLNYLYLSVVRQRNQSRLKQTFMTLTQSESIRQPDVDVNNLLAYTRPSTGLIEGLLQLLFKYCCSSLIDLLSVSCRSLVGCSKVARNKFDGRRSKYRASTSNNPLSGNSQRETILRLPPSHPWIETPMTLSMAWRCSDSIKSELAYGDDLARVSEIHASLATPRQHRHASAVQRRSLRLSAAPKDD